MVSHQYPYIVNRYFTALPFVQKGKVLPKVYLLGKYVYFRVVVRKTPVKTVRALFIILLQSIKDRTYNMYTALIDETKKFFSKEVELRYPKYYSIGRSLQSDIVIQDINISQTHCKLRSQDNTWIIYDKNSNGTKVNGTSLEKCDVVCLEDGDRIDLNDVLTFQFVHRENQNRSSNVDLKPSTNGSIDPEWNVEAAGAKSIPKPSSQGKKCGRVSEDDVSSKRFNIVDVEDELVCSVCTELFVNSITLKCTHSFCEYCIIRWEKMHPYCPLCRARIKDVLPNVIIDKLVANAIKFADKKTKYLREKLVQERKRWLLP